MNKKYIVGGGIIVVFLGVMIFLFTQTNVAYESDFNLIYSADKTVKATGYWVKEKHYTLDSEHSIFSFYIKDENGEQMKVIYKGSIPNNFESSTSVVVTGKYHSDKNYFHAKEILTKCPSKYEEELDARTSI